MNFSDRFQVQLSIVFCLQIWKPVVCNIQNCAWIIFSQNTSNLAGYLFIKAFFLFHVLKEQLGDILFISFVIASGEAIIFYFEWIVQPICYDEFCPLARTSARLRQIESVYSIGSFVEIIFFIRILLKVYFDFA